MDKAYQNRMRIPSFSNTVLFFVLPLLLAACNAGSGGVYSAASTSGTGGSGPGLPPGPGTTDTTPPAVTITAPTTGTSYTATSTSVTVSCSATDNIALSQISWSNNQGGSGNLSVSGTSGSASFNIALVSGANAITVTARDMAGNTAQKQLTVNYTPPSTSNSVSLAWDAVSAPGLSGYRMYYGTTSRTYQQTLGQGASVGNVTTYTVMGLSSGTRYYFAVTAIDSLGNESAYSNETFKDIP